MTASKRINYLAALALGAATLAGTQASAMTQSEIGAEVAFASSLRGTNVPAGRSTEMGFVAAYDAKTCRRSRVKVRVNQPKNGTVRTTAASRSFSTGQVRTNKCAGSPIGGMRVIYTPKPGFRGSDAFTINVSYPTGGSRRTATEGFRFNVR